MRMQHSRDKENPQYHKGVNNERVYVSHYKIDGVVIKSGNNLTEHRNGGNKL